MVPPRLVVRLGLGMSIISWCGAFRVGDLSVQWVCLVFVFLKGYFNHGLCFDFFSSSDSYFSL